MTQREFRLLEKRIAPQIPEFSRVGNLLTLPSEAHLFRAISFQPSGFDKSFFYVHVFVLPLFVPVESIHLTFGKRLRVGGGNEGWLISSPTVESDLIEAIQMQAVPFLVEMESPKRFAEYLSLLSWNPHARLASAAVLVKLGSLPEADLCIEAAIQAMGDRAWEEELKLLLRTLRSRMVLGQSAALELLEEWEAETRRNLKLGGSK